MEKLFKVNRYVMLGGKILVGSILIGATLLLFVNVMLRYVFHYGISWAEEIVRYTMLWTVFVGAGVVSREGTHVSMEAFFTIWPERIQRIGFLGINMFCIATILIIFFFGSGLVKMVVETGQTTEAASIPMWLIYSAFPIGSTLMMLGYIETAWRDWNRKPILDSDILLRNDKIEK